MFPDGIEDELVVLQAVTNRGIGDQASKLSLDTAQTTDSKPPTTKPHRQQSDRDTLRSPILDLSAMASSGDDWPLRPAAIAGDAL
jgi:hypothetical protein